jgi:beta-glucanase (GH16 family)
MSYLTQNIARTGGVITTLFGLCIVFLQIGCMTGDSNQHDITLNAIDHVSSSTDVLKGDGFVIIEPHNYITFNLDVPVSGRYKIEINGSSDSGIIWIEDYIFNADERTYNITGDIAFNSNQDISQFKYGSPLAKGIHPIKIHAKHGSVKLQWLKLSPMIIHDSTYAIVEQDMTGDKWELVWSDEFEYSGLPDTTKWAYNVGDWGWGNNELQYYIESDTNNSRVHNGQLIIQAHKDKATNEWTSARLTTHGQYGFQYGKIEFRAKVPHNRGTWAAGWMLGSQYKDEISWPYCGEIDILECVGFEINDTTKNGLNHATCHTRKYYFKQGNQIGSDTTLVNMTDSFHTYSVEWYPDVIYGLVDGVRYYVYDKNKDSLEWPFDKPQDIIINLAIGGGWGGAKGLDPEMKSPQYIIDYVRVYDLK